MKCFRTSLFPCTTATFLKLASKHDGNQHPGVEIGEVERDLEGYEIKGAFGNETLRLEVIIPGRYMKIKSKHFRWFEDRRFIAAMCIFQEW